MHVGAGADDLPVGFGHAVEAGSVGHAVHMGIPGGDVLGGIEVVRGAGHECEVVGVAVFPQLASERIDAFWSEDAVGSFEQRFGGDGIGPGGLVAHAVAGLDPVRAGPARGYGFGPVRTALPAGIGTAHRVGKTVFDRWAV